MADVHNDTLAGPHARSRFVDDYERAQQAMAHLRAQLDELDRREQQLVEREARFSADQTQKQADTQRRLKQLAELESLLTSREQSLETRETQTGQREREITQQLQSLEHETKRRLTALESETAERLKREADAAAVAIAIERRQFDEQCELRSSELEQAEIDVRERLTKLEQEFTAAMSARQTAADDEFVTEKQQFDEYCATRNRELAQAETEVQARLTKLEQEVTAAIAARQTAADEEFARHKSEQEQQLRKQREEILADVTQRQQEFELFQEEKQNEFSLREASIAEQEAALQERQTSLEVQLAEQQAALEGLISQQSELQQQYEAEKAAHDEAIAAWEAEQTQQRDVLTQEIEELRRTRLTALDQREEELRRREINAEKRVRVHEEHLGRVRDELEAARNEQRREQQQHQNWVQQVEHSIHLRLAQMRRFRDLMTQREDSLTEEKDLFDASRREIEMRLALSRNQLESDRAAWETQRERTRQHLEHQRNQLEAMAESLEQQRQGMESLTANLSESVEEANTFRAAVDDAWSSFMTNGNPQQAEQKLYQTRRDLIDHFRSMEESLLQQREELAQSLVSVQQQQANLSDQEAQHVDWFAQRDEDLTKREASVREAFDEIAQRQNLWHTEREQWRQDRIAAEQIIRQLVQQLEKGFESAAALQNKASSEAA
ncbi:MAG: hypothetical protein R3C18_22730 [Planctomycetaceae bacterium]